MSSVGTFEDQNKSSVPTWVGPVVLLVCLLAVGWFIWWYLWGSLPRERIVTVDPEQVRQENIRGGMRQIVNRVAQPPPPGVQILREGEWLATAHGSAMRISRQSNDFRIRLFYTSGLLTPAQQQLVIAQTRLTRDNAMAKQVGLTPQQVAELRKFDQPAMQVDDAERTKLKELWISYNSADKSAKPQAIKPLLAALEQAGKTSLEPTKTAVAKQTAQLAEIITPDVLARLNGKKPATAPATRAAA